MLSNKQMLIMDHMSLGHNVMIHGLYGTTFLCNYVKKNFPWVKVYDTEDSYHFTRNFTKDDSQYLIAVPSYSELISTQNETPNLYKVFNSDI
jgi:hypothetical protein